MLKNSFNIYRRVTFIILVIIISGLLNICLFAFQAKAATPKLSALKTNFANNNYYGYDEACATDTTPEPAQILNRPSAPMPQCCLTQNRNFNTVVNTTNDKSAPTCADLIISPLTGANPKNNSTFYTARLTYPPPATLALASVIIRE